MKRSSAFPIVVSGPSGSGKTTLLEKLVPADPRLKLSVSATTRPAREGEREGKAYFFVSPERFESLKDGELAEWAEVHGYWYGTPKRFLREQLENGCDVVMNLDVQGGLQVKKAFPEAVLIFILPPSYSVLRRRIEERGLDGAGTIEVRLENARREIEEARRYDYLVVNDGLDQAVADLGAIISAERSRRERRLGEFMKTFYGA
ncbi:MAG: guanylate kinase [Chitinivibrionia bacterium]|nr:guanylate kinase [Chitinivibrionia bacterium]